MKGGKEKGSASSSSSYKDRDKGHLHETLEEKNQEVQQQIGSTCYDDRNKRHLHENSEKGKEKQRIGSTCYKDCKKEHLHETPKEENLEQQIGSTCYEDRNKGHLHETLAEENQEKQPIGSICCPNCSHKFELAQETVVHFLHKFVGKFSGLKFEPSDEQLIDYLEAKVHDHLRPEPLMDEFITTIGGERGICYTHPERMPGVTSDGTIKHFLHRPSKAYRSGTRKRRKIHCNEYSDFPETRWHKTGKTKPVISNGAQKGCKKILVLYTDFGKGEKASKTNWIMHQYHLGGPEDESEGEFVLSKIFYQIHPRLHTEGKRCDVTYENLKIGSTQVSSEQKMQLLAREPIGYMQMPPHLNMQESLAQVSSMPAFHLNALNPPLPVSPIPAFHLNMPNVSFAPVVMAPPMLECILPNNYQQNMLPSSSYQLNQEQQFTSNATASLEEMIPVCISSADPKELQGTANAHSSEDWRGFFNWQTNNPQDPEEPQA